MTKVFQAQFFERALRQRMHMKNISISKVLPALSLVCLLAFSSCSSKELSSEEAPSLPVSEASLLSDSPTDSQNDSSVFADLDPAKAKSDAALAMPVDASAGPFYTAIGGESLGRVAYTLYGDRSFRKQLAKKNAGLAKNLTAGQPVYFDFAQVKPEPTYLTKDLLDRYPTELSDKLKGGASAGTVTLQQGETLQDVSKRLYGTTRYWPELYLLNHEKITHYDKVSAGLTLATLEHNGASPAPTRAAPVADPMKDLAPIEAPVNTQAAPVAQPTMDPLGETPEQEIPTPAPSAVTRVTPVTPAPQEVVTHEIQAPATMMDKITDSNNANLRRIIYVLLIVSIGGAAFYFTRPTRKSKIDMLDVTAGSTAPPPPRSRLGAKETTRKTVG
jgi:hypothetical protein